MTSELLLSIMRLSIRCLSVCPSNMTSLSASQSTASLSASAGEAGGALGSCRSDEGAAGQDVCARGPGSGRGVGRNHGSSGRGPSNASPERPACCGRGGGGGCPVCIAVRPRAETCRHRRSAPVSSSLSQPGQLTGPVHLCQCERRHRGSARHLGVPHDTAQLPRERPLELSRRTTPDVRGGRAAFSCVECMHKLTTATSLLFPTGTRRACCPFLHRSCRRMRMRGWRAGGRCAPPR
jgi:hypothetical protein